MDFSLIPIPVLFIVSLLSATLQGVASTYHAKKMIAKPSDFYLQNTVASLVCAGTLFALSGFSLKLSLFTFLLAIGFGVVTMIQSVLKTKAVNIGPWSYTSVIINSSTILTALSGFLFWDEKIGALKIVGIILMTACLVLSVEKKEDENRANAKWLIYCLFVVVFTAGVGIMQKVHQSSSYRNELWAFLVLAFLFSSVSSGVAYFAERNKEKLIAVEKNNRFVFDKKKFWFAFALFVVIGTMTASINAINLYLSGVIESAVFFPIINGGTLMLSLLAAFVVFKEKLTKRQWMGLGIGIIAVLFLCF